LARSLARRTRGTRTRSGPARLFCVVIAGQLRMGTWLFQALRPRACGLRHAATHPEGQRAFLFESDCHKRGGVGDGLTLPLSSRVLRSPSRNRAAIEAGPRPCLGRSNSRAMPSIAQALVLTLSHFPAVARGCNTAAARGTRTARERS